MDETLNREPLAASANTIDGCSETTCLLCLWPCYTCLAVCVCAFFSTLQLGLCDKTNTWSHIHMHTQSCHKVRTLSFWLMGLVKL